MLSQRQLTMHQRHAVDAAHAVGPLLLRWAGRPTQVRTKRSAIDLVTEVDQRAESIIYRRLRRVNRTYGFLGEESGLTNDGAEYQWCVDPIDGTTNFVHGVPLFCVSIALLERGVPIVGVIYDPTRDEMFTAQHRGGAYLNRKKIRVSRTRRLRHALLATGFPSEFRTNPRKYLKSFEALQLRTHAVRRMGSAALNLAYVACGRLEGVWEEKIWPWDVAAALVLIHEAGGRVTTLTGHAYHMRDRKVLATNKTLHPAVLRALRAARR